MFKIVSALSVVLGLVSLLSGATAQLTCSSAIAPGNFNYTLFSGTWYEVARNPAIESSVACVKMDFTAMPNGTLQILTMYANSSALNVSLTATTNLQLNQTNADGSFTLPSGAPDAIFGAGYFKLLFSDYNNYAMICGYTNANDPSTSYGAILTRVQIPDNKTLQSYESAGASPYANFMPNMPTVIQSDKCFATSATPPPTTAPSGSATLSLASALIAGLWVLLHLLN